MMNLRNTFNEDSFEYTTMNDIIAEGMRQPKRQALYKNLWYENELCVLFGASNCGKSIYAMQIAKHIAQEQPILYFDYELNIQQICDRYTNDEGTSPCKFPQNIFRPNLDFDILSCSLSDEKVMLLSHVSDNCLIKIISGYLDRCADYRTTE